jgi:alanine dehydrogenase
VLVETQAGAGIGAGDAEYEKAGAEVAAACGDLRKSRPIVKVKEPLAQERTWLRAGQALFTYLHLAADAEQTRDLVKSGAIAIAYETVSSPTGSLPLLAPMSVVAGRMAVQVAAHFLERTYGGRGVLLAGATGVPPGRVLILGAGVVGSNAALIALGIGAEVAVLSRSRPRAPALGTRPKSRACRDACGHRTESRSRRRHGSALLPGTGACFFRVRRWPG